MVVSCLLVCILLTMLIKTLLEAYCNHVSLNTNSLLMANKRKYVLCNNMRLFSTTHRLERIISNRGIGSRNEVSKLISQGRVAVNGKVIKSGSVKYPIDCIISIDGKSITALPLLAIYNKPVNVISSIGDPWGRTSLDSLYPEYPYLKQMHPVGRLDADTSGLLLFSKEGKLTQFLLNPNSEVTRIYKAHVLGKVNFNELQHKLKSGVNTTDGTFPAELLTCDYYEEVLFTTLYYISI